MLSDQIIARIKATAPALNSIVSGALELAALLKAETLPQRLPAAYVIPLGIDAEPPALSANVYSQSISRGFGVVILAAAAGDATGARSRPLLDQIEAELIAGLCGWEVPGATGVLELRRSRLIGLDAGAVQQQLDFSLSDFVRITA